LISWIINLQSKPIHEWFGVATRITRPIFKIVVIKIVLEWTEESKEFRKMKTGMAYFKKSETIVVGLCIGQF
jgi:hypothetical protein